jgi:hypothetical protein
MFLIDTKAIHSYIVNLLSLVATWNCIALTLYKIHQPK